MFIRHTDDAEEVDEDTFFHDPRSRRHGRAIRRSSSPTRSARSATPTPAGTSTPRRRPTATPSAPTRAQRALPARAPAAGRALLHLPRARPPDSETRASTLWAEYERVEGERALRDAPRPAASRSTRCSASCSARKPRDHLPPAPTGTSSCSSATTRRSPRSRPSSASTPIRMSRPQIRSDQPSRLLFARRVFQQQRRVGSLRAGLQRHSRRSHLTVAGCRHGIEDGGSVRGNRRARGRARASRVRRARRLRRHGERAGRRAAGTCDRASALLDLLSV